MPASFTITGRVEIENDTDAGLDQAVAKLKEFEDAVTSVGAVATDVAIPLEGVTATLVAAADEMGGTLAQKLELTSAALAELSASFESGAITAEDYASRAEQIGLANESIRESFQNVSQGARDAGQAQAESASIWDDILLKVGGLTAGLLTLRQVYAGTAEAARMEGVANSIAQELGGGEAALTSFIGKLQTAANETISVDDALKSASRAVLLGVPIDKLAEVLEVAHDNATRLGIDTAEAFDRLTRAIAIANDRAFRSAGILVDTGKAMNEYALANNIGTDAITRQQRAAIAADATIEAYNKRVKEMGVAHAETADKIQASAAATSNFWGAVGNMFKGGLADLEGVMAPATKAVTTFIENLNSVSAADDALSKSGVGLGEAMQQAAEGGRVATTWYEYLLAGVGAVIPAMQVLGVKAQWQAATMAESAAAMKRSGDAALALKLANDQAQYGANYLGMALGRDVAAGADGARVAFEKLVAAQKEGADVTDNELVRGLQAWATALASAREQLTTTADASDMSVGAQIRHAEALARLDAQYRAISEVARMFGIDMAALAPANEAAAAAVQGNAAATRNLAASISEMSGGTLTAYLAALSQVTAEQADMRDVSALTSAALVQYANDTSTASEWVRDLTASLADLNGQLILTGSGFSSYLVQLNQVKAGYQQLKQEEDKLKGPRGFMDSPDDMLPTTIGVSMGGMGSPARSNVGDPIGSKYTTYDARYGNVTAQRIYDNQGRWGEFIWLPDGTMVESGRQGITFFGKSTGTYGPLVSNFRQYGSNT